MENQPQQPQNTSSLCSGGCGFYGSSATEGLCSKCFKDSIKRKQNTTSSATQRLGPGSNPAPPSSMTAGSAASAPLTASTATLSIASAVAEVVAAQQAVVHSNSESTKAAHHGGITGAVAALATSTVISPSVPIPIQLSLSSSAGLGASPSSGEESATITPLSKKPNRCHECKKRVGLTGFACRCGGLYCSEHRYADTHNCSFDYKTMEREELRKNNPMVTSEKIRKL